MNQADRSSNTTEVKQRAVRLREWRAAARRAWPITLTALTALVIVGWAVARRGGKAEAEAGQDQLASEREAKVATMVTLDSAAQRFVGIALASASASGGESLAANGTITYDANRASVVAPRAEGRVLAVRADLGEQVRPGSILATLESPDVSQTQGEWERARAALDLARQNHEREQRLFEQSISSRKDLLEAEKEYRSAQADLNSTASRLRSFGAAPEGGGRFNLVSSISGMVVERNAMPGQIAGPSTILFTVADMRRLWIAVDVYESDAIRVRRGANAWVLPRALPGERFLGRVFFAGAVVDSVSRTVKVRVEIDNLNMRLKPGMFAQVEFDAPATRGGVIVIPESAVQDLNGKTVVFVPGAVKGQFVVRQVTLGSRLPGAMVTVLEGLQLSETVVAKGAFQLKGELLKATFADDD